MVPKGFSLKFHTNLMNQSPSVLLKCSWKLMLRTINSYKNDVVLLDKRISGILNIMEISYPASIGSFENLRCRKELYLNKVLRSRRKRKFKRDGLSEEKHFQHAERILCNFDSEVRASFSKKDRLKQEILQHADIPSYDPY